MKRLLAAVLAAVLLAGAAAGGTTLTAQILDYEKGYLFLTTGDGFRVAPDAAIVGGAPQARRYARITFDPTGTITRIEVSRSKLPPEGDLDAVRHFAITLSTPAPNPDLAPPTDLEPLLAHAHRKIGSRHDQRSSAAGDRAHGYDLHDQRPKRLERPGVSPGPRRCAALSHRAQILFGHGHARAVRSRLDAIDSSGRKRHRAATVSAVHRR